MPNRDILSDLYNKHTPIMGEKVGFEDAYPTIASLQLEVIEDEGGIGKKYPADTFSERQFSAVVNCHNNSCYGGGVDIGRLLHKLADGKRTVIDESLPCSGYEGTKTRRDRSCCNRFSVKGTITYKPDNALDTPK